LAASSQNPEIRVLPEDVANKIAAGEVVERPASVVKELVENALDAGATRICVRVVAAGRRLIEVVDNGHGMSKQNALLAVERHATSKIRTAEDLDGIGTMGFRGEALASIASVSHFVLCTRRAEDPAGTRLYIDGGSMREVSEVGTPVGTRISVSRLYFNTPVRAKFLKGITTELSHCIDVVQRHALAREGVGFQFFHNEKLLLDVPEHATLIDRIALIWGLSFSREMVELHGEQAGLRVRGYIGLPGLTRAARSHQFFFINQRPVINRTLQYGLQEGYRQTVMIGRHPVCVLLLEANPRFVDVNIHPSKREVRFRDEREIHDAIRDIVRARLERLESSNVIRQRGEEQEQRHAWRPVADWATPPPNARKVEDIHGGGLLPDTEREDPAPAVDDAPGREVVAAEHAAPQAVAPVPDVAPMDPEEDNFSAIGNEELEELEQEDLPPDDAEHEAAPWHFALQSDPVPPSQDALPGFENPGAPASLRPGAVYEGMDHFHDEAFQLFDTYLLVPAEDRLLIIDQHALHERLNYETLLAELRDAEYEAQQLAVPIVIEVAPSQVRLLESNLDAFKRLGIDIEPFGGNTFQVTAICHLYDTKLVRDLVYKLLDDLGQGDLFDMDHFMAEALRLATRACHASIRGGDRLSREERRGLIEGFRRLRPPYTCPHGRPIIVELTQAQMEKSFGRLG
jgi:DNA mismatch repair protein MutL